MAMLSAGSSAETQETVQKAQGNNAEGSPEMAKASATRIGDGAELVISAPPLNLFDGQMVSDLEAALNEIGALTGGGGAREGAARAVLIRAEGTVFCAGVDVHEFQGLGPAQGAAQMARFLSVVQTLERVPVPTIA